MPSFRSSKKNSVKKSKGKEEPKSKHDKLHICLLGTVCGKSSLLNRYVNNEFETEYDATLQDFRDVAVTVENEQSKLLVMDTSGDAATYAESLYPKWFAWGEAFIFVFAVDDNGTFDELKSFKAFVDKAQKKRDYPKVLVGTRIDEENREVLTSEGKAVAFDWKCPYIECSSKSGANVTDVFHKLVLQIRNWGKEKEEHILSRVEREKLYQQAKEKKLRRNQERTPSAQPARRSMLSASAPALQAPIKRSRGGNARILPSSSPGGNMVIAREGWVIERGQARQVNHVYHDDAEELQIQHDEHNIVWYQEYFAESKHVNYLGIQEEDNVGPVVISVVKEGKDTIRVLLWLTEGTTRKLVERKRMKGVKFNAKNIVKDMDPRILFQNLTAVSNKELTEELVTLEKQLMVYDYKFGVIYCTKENTCEDDILCNETGSEAFNQFLGVIGKKITLKGWKEFRGGLDVTRDATGKESVFARYQDKYSIMYHVSTLLPYSEMNEQQLDRKRHIGNDIIVVVFLEQNAVFDPQWIRSEFNHVFYLVQKDLVESKKRNKLMYRVVVVTKDGIPPCVPYLPSPNVFEANEAFKTRTLAKLINSENACYKAPVFVKKSKMTRKMFLSHIVSTYGKK